MADGEGKPLEARQWAGLQVALVLVTLGELPPAAAKYVEMEESGSDRTLKQW